MQNVSVDIAAPLLAYDAFVGFLRVCAGSSGVLGDGDINARRAFAEECVGAWRHSLARGGLKLDGDVGLGVEYRCVGCGGGSVYGGHPVVHLGDSDVAAVDVHTGSVGNAAGTGATTVNTGLAAKLRDHGVSEDSSSVPVSERTLRNRKKRAKARARKLRKQAAPTSAEVPEWRQRKQPSDVDACCADSTSVRHTVKCSKSQGYFGECDESTKLRLRETRAQLLIAQNERRLVEEKRKLNELRSPVQLIQDAMRLAKFAEACAKKTGDSKVAGWAATVTNSYAESVARSAPSSVPSFDSVTSANALNVKRERWSLAAVPLTPVEKAAVSSGILTERAVEGARVKVSRVLCFEDFYLKSAGFRLSIQQERALKAAVTGEVDNQYLYDDAY